MLFFSLLVGMEIIDVKDICRERDRFFVGNFGRIFIAWGFVGL